MIKKVLTVALGVFIANVAFSLLVGCSKEELRVVTVTTTGEEVCAIDIDIHTDWEFDAGGGFILRHTDGLREMALSGSHGTLNREFCKRGKSDMRIPNGLDDAPLDGRDHEGYAGQMVYGNHIVAMYHPTYFRDHFITYNTTNGVWIRWDLSEGPGKYSHGQYILNKNGN